jgi:hypothetical protein
MEQEIICLKITKREALNSSKTSYEIMNMNWYFADRQEKRIFKLRYNCQYGQIRPHNEKMQTYVKTNASSSWLHRASMISNTLMSN